MTLTIVIPTLNAARDIGGCLNSIRRTLRGQLGDRVRVRIQDGGSGDGTLQAAGTREFEGLEISSSQDGGVYSAMNRAVAAIRTDWVYFLGADDRLLPGFVSALRELNDPAVIYYANVRMKSDGRRYDGRFYALKLVYRNICHQGMFFPRAIIANSPFDATLRVHADWAKNIELMAQHPFCHLAHDVCSFNDLSGLSHDLREAHFDRAKTQLFRDHYGPGLAFLSRTASLPTRIYHSLRGREHAPRRL